MFVFPLEAYLNHFFPDFGFFTHWIEGGSLYHNPLLTAFVGLWHQSRAGSRSSWMKLQVRRVSGEVKELEVEPTITAQQLLTLVAEIFDLPPGRRKVGLWGERGFMGVWGLSSPYKNQGKKQGMKAWGCPKINPIHVLDS